MSNSKLVPQVQAARFRQSFQAQLKAINDRAREIRSSRYAKILAVFFFLVTLVGAFYYELTPLIVERESWVFRLTPYNLYPTDLLIIPVMIFLALVAPTPVGMKKTSRWFLLILWWILCAIGMINGIIKENSNLPADIRNFVLRPILAVAIYRMANLAELKRFRSALIKLSLIVAFLLVGRRLLILAGVDVEFFIGSWGAHALLFPYTLLFMEILSSDNVSLKKILALFLIAIAIFQDFWKPVVTAFALLHVFAFITAFVTRYSKSATANRLKIRRLILSLLLFGAIFTLIVTVDTSLTDTWREEYLKEGAVIRDLTGQRFQIWNSALTVWRKEPIFGAGFGRLLSGTILSAGTGKYIFLDTYYVHNVSLQILYQVGLIGAVIFAVILILWIISVFHTSRRIPRIEIFDLYMGTVIFILASFYITQIGESYNNAVAGTLLWAALGLEAAIADQTLSGSLT